MRCLCTAYALLYALLYVAHSRSTHGHDTGHRSHFGRLSHLGQVIFLRPRRSPHRYSEPAQLKAPRGAGEETGSSPGHACLLTEAHGKLLSPSQQLQPPDHAPRSGAAAPDCARHRSSSPGFSGFPSCFPRLFFPC
ncbi:hypothetical protein NDU88_008243 [Pleurodeles waltl]|uniref:Secreted protein n=1 Tax=Pleurodeles waltl TaxID=8319 RepID=A0AAV7QPC3_PLEWA|nr:hypothetical protein NDU88_008243 [Pleurodeles waltl]